MLNFYIETLNFIKVIFIYLIYLNDLMLKDFFIK